MLNAHVEAFWSILTHIPFCQRDRERGSILAALLFYCMKIVFVKIIGSHYYKERRILIFT